MLIIQVGIFKRGKKMFQVNATKQRKLVTHLLNFVIIIILSDEQRPLLHKSLSRAFFFTYCHPGLISVISIWKLQSCPNLYQQMSYALYFPALSEVEILSLYQARTKAHFHGC